MRRGKVIIVDDEPNILKTLTIFLESVNFYVEAFSNPIDASLSLNKTNFDIAFFDLKMAPIDGMQLLKECKQKSPETTVVIITAHGSIDSAVEAIKSGAEDFIQKPFNMQEFQLFTERIYRHHSLKTEIKQLKEKQIITGGMLPKIDNITMALKNGVEKVILCHAEDLLSILDGNSKFGTTFTIN